MMGHLLVGIGKIKSIKMEKRNYMFSQTLGATLTTRCDDLMIIFIIGSVDS